jgi:hypothetical protein
LLFDTVLFRENGIQHRACLQEKYAFVGPRQGCFLQTRTKVAQLAQDRFGKGVKLLNKLETSHPIEQQLSLINGSSAK